MTIALSPFADTLRDMRKSSTKPRAGNHEVEALLRGLASRLRNSWDLYPYPLNSLGGEGNLVHGFACGLEGLGHQVFFEVPYASGKGRVDLLARHAKRTYVVDVKLVGVGSKVHAGLAADAKRIHQEERRRKRRPPCTRVLLIGAWTEEDRGNDKIEWWWSQSCGVAAKAPKHLSELAQKLRNYTVLAPVAVLQPQQVQDEEKKCQLHLLCAVSKNTRPWPIANPYG